MIAAAWFLLGVLLGPPLWIALWLVCCLLARGEVKVSINGRVKTWRL